MSRPDGGRPRGKPAAFVLTGSFLAICRAPRYLSELAARGLKILVITGSGWREQAESGMKDPDHPASAIADIAFVDGSVDRDGSYTPGVIAAARAWAERYDLVGAYAAGETMVEPTTLVADAYALRSPGLRAGRVCRSKYLQRLYLAEFSPAVEVLVPGGRDEPVAPRAGFPVVVKPATRHSSSGVATAADGAELAGLVAGYPEHETLLVEQKITGQEYSVESLVQDGEVVFAGVTRKETTEDHADTFVELSHTVTGPAEPGREELLSANRRVLERLGFQDGIAHAEWRLAADGRAYLMEIAARPPGDGITALYHLATGQPLEPEIIRIALGEPAGYPRPTRHARQVYPEHRPGVLESVTVDWPGVRAEWAGEGDLWPEVTPGAPHDPPTLRAVFVQKAPGTRAGPLRSSEDRVANFIADAPTADGLDALEARVRAAVTIRTTPDGAPGEGDA